jgi:hypothetical protein
MCLRLDHHRQVRFRFPRPRRIHCQSQFHSRRLMFLMHHHRVGLLVLQTGLPQSQARAQG